MTSISCLPSSNSEGQSTQWLSTGGSTVSITDARKGILVRSEDQGEELLSSTTFHNTKALVGSEKGVIREWQVGVWDDNEKVVKITDGEERASADVLTEVPDSDLVAAGMDDGYVRFLQFTGSRFRFKSGKSVKHDEIEGVTALSFVPGGKMVSGGGQTVNIWERMHEDEERSGSDENDTGAESSNGHLSPDSDEADGDDSGGDTSDEDQPEQRKRKRRKKNQGKGKWKGQARVTFSFKGLD